MKGGPPSPLAVHIQKPVVLFDDAIHSGQSSPVPLPISLVVKNGSNTRSRVAVSIPAPVSDTLSRRHFPALPCRMTSNPPQSGYGTVAGHSECGSHAKR